MAMEPAAISASPAVTMIAAELTAPDRPAASAKGTVSPSDMPMTISRTVSPAVKCCSTCGVCGMHLSHPYPRLPVYAYVMLIVGDHSSTLCTPAPCWHWRRHCDAPPPRPPECGWRAAH